MKFHFAGKYNSEEDLIRRPDPEGSVMFKEPENMNKMALIMNLAALAIAVAMIVLLNIRNSEFRLSFAGSILMLISMVPHEFLHGICFKEGVDMYTNLSKGMLFVYGTEDMSKGRFIFMSLLPNIVFGFIPFMIYMIFPVSSALGTMAALAISAGAGDYMNVFHALTEVPGDAKIYCNGIHSYWYIPEKA